MSPHARVTLFSRRAPKRRRTWPVRAALAVAVLGVGFVSTGSALASSAAAAEKAGSAVIASNTLTITGTNGPDVVDVSADATKIQVAFAADPANPQRFNLADFNAISVSLGNGDDQFTMQAGVLANKTLTVNGGNGDDTINTGDGNDVIFGGNGNDRVNAGKGADTVILGNDDDFFVWLPGQGSDVVDGGKGTEDVMQFDGADASEIMSLSANGSQAVFLRNVGTIRMDMDGIEIFNLAAFGGNDDVTVGNLEGTSIRHANLDLSATTGGSDHVPDTVTVNGTNHDDQVDVTTQAGTIDVAGLQADTQITGSETLDHLQVDTLDGHDTVTVDPNVFSLIDVDVDLGAGQI